MQLKTDLERCQIQVADRITATFKRFVSIPKNFTTHSKKPTYFKRIAHTDTHTNKGKKLQANLLYDHI